MNKEVSDIIIKSIADKPSAVEKLVLSQKLTNEPQVAAELKTDEEIWELAAYYHTPSEIDVDSEWNRFYQNNIKSSNSSKTIDNEIKLLPQRSWLKVVASVAIIATLASVSWYIFNKPQKSNLVWYNVTAPLGSRTQVILSDSTKVWLNAGSSIKYTNKYNIQLRDIKLTGEAYFEVTPNKNVPFVVNAADLKIKVLGTAFNVKAYNNDTTVETTLMHGSVALQKYAENKPISEEVILKPKQKLTYIKPDSVHNSDSKVQFVIKYIKDINTETAWTEGRLVFDSERLDKISEVLTRKFNIEIAFSNDAIKSMKYTGKLEDLSLEQILSAIVYSSPVKYNINQKKVLFY